jgi:hypothetical protein
VFCQLSVGFPNSAALQHIVAKIHDKSLERIRPQLYSNQNFHKAIQIKKSLGRIYSTKKDNHV